MLLSRHHNVGQNRDIKIANKSFENVSQFKLGEKRKAYKLLVGKPEGKRPLGKPRWRLVHNIKMDFGER
jgi:hypothetical protein